MPDSSALPAVRISLSKKIRFEIFKRDGFTCQGYQKIMQARADRIEAERWRVVWILFPGEERCRRDYLRSIGLFIERLGVHDVMDSADIAMSKRIWNDDQRFRYFCGCCWAKITELEQLRTPSP
jgi:hypothetical protein